MTTFRTTLTIPMVLLALAACSSDASTQASSPAVTSAATTPPAASTVAPQPTAPSPTTPQPTTSQPSTTVAEGPLQIDVLIGTDDSPTRIERARLGSPVTLNITNPDAADEFHLHGYNLEQAVGAGVTSTMNFIADQAGTFEVESHETGTVLVQLEVG